MAKRKGAAKGKGSGYKNLPNYPKDPMVHSMSAKGMKQPQEIKGLEAPFKPIYAHCPNCGQSYDINVSQECPQCQSYDGGKIWKKYKSPYYEGSWVNKQGDTVTIEMRQDRDGKNAFVYTAVFTNRSALGTARDKRKIIAKGRNENLIKKKAEEYMFGDTK